MVLGVEIKSGHLVDVNPATGREIARVKVSTAAEVDAAVAAARKAQPGWESCSLAERSAAVRSAVNSIAAKAASLAALVTQEMGKALREAQDEIGPEGGKDSYVSAVTEANKPEVVGSSVIVRQAHGVVALCTPWNFPVEEIVMLAVPALIAGNAVVVKPSEVTPLSGGQAVECLMASLNKAHPGLVNLLQGDGAVGSQLVAHPGVDMVAFTGSSATATKIMKAASETLKPLVLECGGKDPMVVLEDADLDLAAQDAVTYSLLNCGQVCCAVERVYVASSVAATFHEKVLEQVKSVVVGDGKDPATTMGPMVSESQRQIVHGHVRAAVAAGARCLLGGEMPPAKEPGNFYPATVLVDVPHSAKEITQEETFGPVVAVSTFDGKDEEAVKLANDSTYGLTASVYSRDVAHAARVASRISAGQVGINNNALSGNAHELCPFVGHRRSGYGSHSGKDGWRQFSVPKSLIYTAPPSATDLPPVAKDTTRARGKPQALALAAAAALAAMVLLALQKRRWRA